MVIELWLAFVAASWVMLVIPGPTILTVIGYSIVNGKRARAPLVLGVAAGDSTSLLLSMVGLSAAVNTSPLLFTFIQWVGGIFLIALGAKLLMAKSLGLSLGEKHSQIFSSRFMFTSLWIITSFNPKNIVFFSGFLPQFVDSTTSVTLQLWALAITFVCLGVLSTILYVNFAQIAQNRFLTARAQRYFNVTGGSILAVTGVWVLMRLLIDSDLKLVQNLGLQLPFW